MRSVSRETAKPNIKCIVASLQFSSDTMLYLIKNKHQAAGWQDGSQSTIKSLLGARRSEAITQLNDWDQYGRGIQSAGWVTWVEYMRFIESYCDTLILWWEEGRATVNVKLPRADKLILTTDCWTILTTETNITTAVQHAPHLASLPQSTGRSQHVCPC